MCIRDSIHGDHFRWWLPRDVHDNVYVLCNVAPDDLFSCAVPREVDWGILDFSDFV